MIDKSYELYTPVCDGCGETLEECYTFEGAIDECKANGEKAIYATDTEHLNGITAKDYDLYMIEANYTEEDLAQRIIEKTARGEYCYELNVASRHLSHEQASEFLLKNMGEHSEYVFLHQHQSKKTPKEWDYADS